MSDGILADRYVVWPLHDRRFDLATGAALSGGEGVAAHRVDVKAGMVFVELAATELDRAA